MNSIVKLTLFSLISLLSFSQSQTTTQTSNLTECTDQQYLDPLTLSCKACPAGYLQYAGTSTSCFCIGNLAFVDNSYPKVGGFVCSANNDGAPCKASFKLDGSVDADASKCVLQNTATQLNADLWYKRVNYEGFEFYYKYNSFKPTGCITQISNVPKLSCQIDQVLDYQTGENNEAISSQFMIHHYDQAYIAMKTYNYHQKLANLCAISLYSQNENKPCQLYQKIAAAKKAANDAFSKFFIFNINLDPTYIDIFSTTYKIHPLRIPGKQTDEPTRKPYINFKLVTYDLEGNFINMDVTNSNQFANLDNQIFLCPSTDRDGQNFKEFGTDFTLECTINAAQFFNDRSQSVFYELLIETNSTESYVRVPVQIKGQTNYFTRFFIVDNISGFSAGDTLASQSYLNPDGLPSRIVVAKNMEMIIQIQPDNNYISMPILQIEYETVKDSKVDIDISFKASYIQEPSKFTDTAQPLFFTFAALTAIIWLFKYNIWSKYNPQSRNLSPEAFFLLWVGNGIYLLINCWADFSFYFLFFMTGYWFVTYKLQESLYTLMINSATEGDLFNLFKIFIIIQFSFKTAAFIKFLYHQLQTDVLFLDWENQKQFDDEDSEEERFRGISIWRTLFIANEFNELSIERLTSFEWTLFWVGFFLSGLQWDNLGLEVPYLSTSEKDYVRMNEALRYFIAAILYIVIVLIQIIAKKLFIIWNPTPIQNFTDLCTIANISLFIMDEQLHGYYLHGKAPSGISEGNTRWLKEAIEKEALSGQQRGLVKGESVQTFEMYVPIQLRFEYNTEYQTKYDQMRAGYNQDQWILGRTVVKEMISDMHQFKKHIENVIKTYIKEVQIHSFNHVLNKSFINRLLNLPPSDPIPNDLPFFFRDPNMNYCKIFYYGNEWFIVMYEMITFLFFNFVTESPLVAIMITFLFNRIFAQFRDLFGRRNISSKAMIDQRFLI